MEDTPKFMFREVWRGEDVVPVPMSMYANEPIFRAYVWTYYTTKMRGDKNPMTIEEVRKYSTREGFDLSTAMRGYRDALKDHKERESKTKLNRQKAEGVMKETNGGQPHDLALIMDKMRENPGFIPNWAWDN